jgi:hypothetical protein
MPSFDYKKFKTWLAQANTYEKLMSPPLFQDTPSANSDIPVIVNGDIAPFGMKWSIEQRKYPKPRNHSNVPSTTPEQRKLNFEKLKEQKQKNGTWVEKSWESSLATAFTGSDWDARKASTDRKHQEYKDRPKVREEIVDVPDVFLPQRGEAFVHQAHQQQDHKGPHAPQFKLPSYEQAVAIRDAQLKSNFKHSQIQKNSVGRSFSKDWRRNAAIRDVP